MGSRRGKKTELRLFFAGPSAIRLAELQVAAFQTQQDACDNGRAGEASIHVAKNVPQLLPCHGGIPLPQELFCQAQLAHETQEHLFLPALALQELPVSLFHKHRGPYVFRVIFLRME